MMRSLLVALLFAKGATSMAQDQSRILDIPRCEHTVTPFDSERHRPVYTVGVLAIRGDESAFNDFNTTFADYLTSTAGQRFDPPIRFQMKPLNFIQLFTDTEAQHVDFIYVNPSAFSCIESEYGAQSLVSQISRRVVGGKSYELTRFGGVIATLANNSQIDSIQDLEGKVIAAASISGLGSGQMQFKEMLDSGMSYVNDPKQLAFTSNQGKVVQGLLNGDFDVGFVRTDQLEQSKDATGNPIDPAVFKIIDPKPGLESDGMPFPFQSSTPLFPEWNVAALSHVAEDVSLSVQEAMTALPAHARIGEGLAQCNESFNTTFCDALPFPHAFDSGEGSRCDTTPEVATFAYSAMSEGKYAGWRTTLSYMQLRSMQQSTGFISLNQQTQTWQCVRSKEIYQAISCPKGYFRKSKEEVANGCASEGLECKAGFQCLCSPCVKGFDVDVRPVNVDGAKATFGCEKMSICGSTQQRQPLAFQAVDNLDREATTLEVVLHDGQESHQLQVTTSPEAPFVYNFVVSTNLEGEATLEIFLDGEQIPSSPLRVSVKSRDCYGGHQEADTTGQCVCEDGYIEFGDGRNCLPRALVASCFFASILGLVALAFYIYSGYKRRQNDAMWLLSPEDLKYSKPPVVLGQGTFGVVELACLHGTNVAVKRVLPPRAQGSWSFKKSIRSGQLYFGESESSSESMDFLDTEVGSGMGSMSEIGSIASFGMVSGYQAGSMSNLFLKSVQRKEEKKRKGVLALSIGRCFTSRTTDSNASLRKHFIQEMRLLSKLRHPCITTVMGAVIEPKHEPLLVLEHCEMGSLYNLLHNETVHLEGELLLPILRDIVQGIRFLHSVKPTIIHGDLKARNILITRGYRAKVADFGLSQKVKATGAIGTPFWMAPELLRGDARNSSTTDIFALGVVLYELIARKDPYKLESADKSTLDIIRQICDLEVNLRPSIPDHCPPEIRKLIKSCWNEDPAARPSAEDLDERLKLFHVENVEPSNRPSSYLAHAIGVNRQQNDVLYQVFPKHIADSLMRGQKVEPEPHDCVTVFFSDIVGFTTISSRLSPLQVSNLLDRLYLELDALCRKYQIFKVETVGDAFMAVANLIEDQSQDHVKRVAEFSREAIHAASRVLVDTSDSSQGVLELRVGFHSGPVVSSVVGSLNPRFGLFGDTVNVASRMESNSKPSRIHCSYDSAKLLKEQAPCIDVKDRGAMNVKGKGKMKTFWVGGDKWMNSAESDTSDETHSEGDHSV